MPQRRRIEFWQKVRRLVEKGLSLKKASQQFGLSFSHLRERAALEGWQFHGRGRPRALDYADQRQREQMKREQMAYAEAQFRLAKRKDARRGADDLAHWLLRWLATPNKNA